MIREYSSLEEFFDYKNKLMEDLLSDEKIVSLLNDDINPSDGELLAYKQVFPFEYLPETIEASTTFICFDVDITKVPNKTFLYPVIMIWVMCHKSSIRLLSGGIRTDAICSRISEILNGNRFYGLGELNLSSVRRFHPIDDFLGRAMVFETKDFNRLHPSNKVIPPNRKI